MRNDITAGQKNAIMNLFTYKCQISHDYKYALESV